VEKKFLENKIKIAYEIDLMQPADGLRDEQRYQLLITIKRESERDNF
jgi:hypothetical protein